MELHVSECVRGWLDGGAAGAVEAPGVLLSRSQLKAVGTQAVKTPPAPPIASD